MRILLTNDDGIFAPGLAAIYKQLTSIGQVTVAAPADSQSGASHSITYRQPLVCHKVDVNGQFVGYSVQGSPADCVKLAFMELLTEPVELLISGINNGANVGINVYYSGTVAAAMEAAFFHTAAVAMSLAVDDPMDYEKAARYCSQVLHSLLPLTAGKVININIPQLSKGPPKGVKVVPQSTEGFDEYYIRRENEQGQIVFQLAAGPHRDHTTAADTTALANGFITVTALHFDMTDHRKTRQLTRRLSVRLGD
jgi:5'-nucleotidase